MASLKGSADGKAVDFSLRTAAILFAIGKPDLDQADLNRTIMVELRKGNRAKSVPTSKGLHELGVRIRFAMWSHWNDFQSLLVHIHELCADPRRNLHIEARLANTWGVPIAAILCFAELAVKRVAAAGGLPEDDIRRIDEEIVAILSNVRDMHLSNQAAPTGGSDAERALNALLNARVSLEAMEATEGPTGTSRHVRRTDRRVVDALSLAKQEHFAKSEYRYTEESLRVYGLRYSPPAIGTSESARAEGLRCPSNFAFQMTALMPPWMADRHAC